LRVTIHLQQGKGPKMSIHPNARPEQAALNNRYAEHFAWQRHVGARTDLTAAEKLIAWQLALFRNFKHDLCNPGYGGLAEAAGVSERTAIRAVAKLDRLGLIRVDRTAGGNASATNHYHFAMPLGVTRAAGAGVTKAAMKGDRPSRRGVTKPCHANLEENLVGDAKASPNNRERETSVARPRDDLSLGGAGAALRAARAKEGQDGAADEEFAALQAVWPRPWLDDVEAGQRAFEAACQEVTPTAIVEAAAAWAAVVEARFLPPLAKWLGGRGWEKPAPKRTRQRREARSGRHRNGRKVDLARLALEAGGYVETEAGEMVWGGAQ
jgi:hypothetical protein